MPEDIPIRTNSSAYNDVIFNEALLDIDKSLRLLQKKIEDYLPNIKLIKEYIGKQNHNQIRKYFSLLFRGHLYFES